MPESIVKMEVFKNEKFINIVTEYPFLYDKKDIKFKNLKFKMETWHKIGKPYGLSGDQCCKKFKALRDTYTRLKKRINAANKSGAEPIQTKWELYPLLDNLLNNRIYEKESSNNDVLIVNETHEESCETSVDEQYSPICPAEPVIILTDQSQSSDNCGPSKRRRTSDPIKKLNEVIMSVGQKVDDIQVNKNDGNEAFFSFIEIEAKKLPEHVKRKFRNEVHQLLFKYQKQFHED